MPQITKFTVVEYFLNYFSITKWYITSTVLCFKPSFFIWFSYVLLCVCLIMLWLIASVGRVVILWLEHRGFDSSFLLCYVLMYSTYSWIRVFTPSVTPMNLMLPEWNLVNVTLRLYVISWIIKMLFKCRYIFIRMKKCIKAIGVWRLYHINKTSCCCPLCFFY